MNRPNQHDVCASCHMAAGWTTRAAAIQQRFGSVTVVDHSVQLPHCNACNSWFIDSATLGLVEIKTAIAAIRDTGGGLNGEGMKAVRKVFGLTQEHFAKLLGYKSGEHISRLESGAQTPYPLSMQFAALFLLEAAARKEINLDSLPVILATDRFILSLPHDTSLEVTKSAA